MIQSPIKSPSYSPFRAPTSMTLEPDSPKLPKKLSSIITKNLYDVDFVQKEYHERDKSFQFKKQLELHKVQIEKCLNSNIQFLEKIKDAEKTKNKLQRMFQESVLLQIVKEGLRKQKKNGEAKELSQKYQYLFPSIHNSKHIIHRKPMPRKKLNDLILPMGNDEEE